jgi:cytochrome c peroxidase
MQRSRIARALVAAATVFGSACAAAAPLPLSEHCPPYFELSADGACRLRSLYERYPEARAEWGGYRIALPPARDGFSPQQIDLGRYLFFDPVLSGDRDLSCAHCHHPELGLSDARARSAGRGGAGAGPSRAGGVGLPRSAPPLWNLAFNERFFWDARAGSLEQQLESSLFSPNEMAATRESVVEALIAIPQYRALFSRAFAGAPLDFERVETALIAFLTSLVSLNSRYDHYVHGAQDALSARELRGLHVFRSFAARCSQCHSPPLFTSGQLAVIGVPPAPGLPFDPGAAPVLDEPTLRGAFRVPTLRNVARTAPYMHAGQFDTLGAVVEFYNDEPGHAVAGIGRLNLHWHLVNPHLDEQEQADLVAFLETLTDETALPRVPERVPSGLAVARPRARAPAK